MGASISVSIDTAPDAAHETEQAAADQPPATPPGQQKQPPQDAKEEKKDDKKKKEKQMVNKADGGKVRSREYVVDDQGRRRRPNGLSVVVPPSLEDLASRDTGVVARIPVVGPAVGWISDNVPTIRSPFGRAETKEKETKTQDSGGRSGGFVSNIPIVGWLHDKVVATPQRVRRLSKSLSEIFTKPPAAQTADVFKDSKSLVTRDSIPDEEFQRWVEFLDSNPSFMAEWEVVFEESKGKGDDLKIWKRQSRSFSGLHELCAVGVVPFDLATYVRVQCDVDYRTTWDDSCGCLERISRDDVTHTDLLYWVTKFPWPLSDRDYVFFRKLKALAENPDQAEAYVLLSRATSRCPEEYSHKKKNKCERVDLYMSNAYFAPAGPDGKSTRFVVVGIDDPKVSGGSSMISYGASKGMAKFFKTLRKACQGYQQWLDNKKRQPYSLEPKSK